MAKQARRVGTERNGQRCHQLDRVEMGGKIARLNAPMNLEGGVRAFERHIFLYEVQGHRTIDMDFKGSATQPSKRAREGPVARQIGHGAAIEMAGTECREYPDRHGPATQWTG